jgi:hypothetical protein
VAQQISCQSDKQLWSYELKQQLLGHFQVHYGRKFFSLPKQCMGEGGTTAQKGLNNGGRQEKAPASSGWQGCHLGGPPSSTWEGPGHGSRQARWCGAGHPFP